MLLGMPDHWIARAWPVDTAAITRWIVVTTSLETPSGPLVLVCRILGWDQSELPSWTVAAENGRIRITVEERTITTLLDLLDESTRARLDRREVRRVEPPVRRWFRGLSCGRARLTLVDPAPPSPYAVDQGALASVEAIDANGRSRHDRQVDGVILTDPGHCILRMLDEPVSFGL